MANEQNKYNVGGVLMDRPFKIRRLGHFGFNLNNFEPGIEFYTRLLGFRLTDLLDLGKTPRGSAPHVKDARLIFTTYGTDHHALVLGHATMMGNPARPEVTTNQITWQLGSLSEVVHSIDFLRAREVGILRTGRDMPGSNWHVYMSDPDGRTVELYYGMEQVGWERLSKPTAMYDRRFDDTPALPQVSEQTELLQALQNGIDIHGGRRSLDEQPGEFNVEGVLLPRPFKVTRIGPVGLFVNDLEETEAFYVSSLGFVVTEETRYKGHRCVFLRNGTEHHSLGLFPKAVRGELKLSPHSNLMSFGIEVGSYEQLCNAVRFLKARGIRFIESIPADLYPGIDYAAHALDPDGHCIQLYYYMEQIGWDGKPRPKELRRAVSADWPAQLDPLSDTYADQTFQGPLG